jgi:hypothetical protein
LVSIDSTTILLALAILLSFYLVLTVLQDLFRQRRRVRASLEALKEFAVEKEESTANKLSKSFGVFLNKPKSHYYLDKSSIESLYNQVSPSERTVEVEEEIAQETRKGVRGGLSSFGGSYERKGGRTQRERKQAFETIESKYDTIVRYLVEHQQAILGIEAFEYDRQGERLFLEACSDIENYGITIPQDSRNRVISGQKRNFGENKLKEMQTATGYALITGRFLVVPEAQSTSSGFVLSYRHPVGEALGADIRINALCTEHLTDTGKEIFPRIPDIQVAMLALIVRMTDNILNVKPLAIHSV